MSDYPVIFIDQKKYRIRIYKRTLHMLGDPKFIQLLINPDDLLVVVRAVDRSDSMTHRIIWKNFVSKQSYELTSKQLIQNMQSVCLNWNAGGFLYATNSKAVFNIREIETLNLDSISIFDFLEKLSSLFSAKLEANVTLGERRVRASQMSEGQRQLVKMLGMLGVCKNEDCLVLMDEPDAHMNPKWKYEIKSVIDKSLEAAINTQALISTHDPLVINGVNKDFIRIFEYNQALFERNGIYATKICVPTEDTEGMGIDGLLQSEYYGLKTSYDKASSDKYIQRQELYIKLINGEITDDEKVTLRNLTAELGSLPISYNTIDFLYDDFIKAFRDTELYSKEYLSYDDIVARRNRIKEIITALYEGQV